MHSDVRGADSAHRAQQYIAFQGVWPSRIGNTYCQARVYAMGGNRYVWVHVVPAGHSVIRHTSWQLAATVQLYKLSWLHINGAC